MSGAVCYHIWGLEDDIVRNVWESDDTIMMWPKVFRAQLQLDHNGQVKCYEAKWTHRSVP